MTTALERGEGSASRPGRSLPPGKTRYPLYRRLGGPQGRPGQVRKISPPTEIRSPDRPDHSQSLYRLSYQAHNSTLNIGLNFHPKRLKTTIKQYRFINYRTKINIYSNLILCFVLIMVIQRSRVRFPALTEFLSSFGSGTGSTQPREVN
jgi:hypothetical protein